MAGLVRWTAEGKLSAHVHTVYPLPGHARRAQGNRRAQGEGEGDFAALAGASTHKHAQSTFRGKAEDICAG